MKKSTLLFLLMLFGFGLFAEQVPLEKANLVAVNFLKAHDRAASVELADAIVYRLSEYSQDDALKEIITLYIFDIEQGQGFIIVSGDDIGEPVLGYSFGGPYDKTGMPYAFYKLLEQYKQEIGFGVLNGFRPPETTDAKWEALLNGTYVVGEKTVGPLMTTKWNQLPYYNDMCPGNPKSVTGCVATAMAQVMKYWNQPAQGTGMHSYNHAVYGTLSANFGATTYNWAAMPDIVNSPNTPVATLMYHCGVSVNMNYSPNMSGALMIELDTPICTESALKNFFGYSTNMQGLRRSSYTNTQWINMLRSDLDNGRPIPYAGIGSGGGHAFVCDGYTNDYFHFNWGWGGLADGNFLLDALNPGDTGAGGGSGGYNSGQQAIFGVEPVSGGGGGGSGAYDLALYNYVTVNPNAISVGQAFSVFTDVANFGNETFTGDFAALIFDNQANPVDFAATLSGYTMPPQTHFTNGLTFSTSGMTNLMPGDYFIGILFRPTGGEWDFVANNGKYTNMVPFQVVNNNVIALYSPFSLAAGSTIVQNQPFQINVQVANYGSTTFTGAVDVSLYHLDGNFAATVQTHSNISLEGGYYYNMIFASNGLNLQPGTYYLAMLHRPNGGSWQLTGANNYPNPVQAVVQASALQADQFEPNNSQAAATNLNLPWQNNTAHIWTTGANLHDVFDYDYYQLNLPTGNTYTISVRAHDSYNSANGQTYTCDVVWSYRTSFLWVGPYDDVMPGNIVMSNGGTVYLWVGPYFAGSTGTYELEILVTRGNASVEELTEGQTLKLYPNPVKTDLYIDRLPPGETAHIKLYDIAGKLLREEQLKSNLGVPALNVADLPEGTYQIKLEWGGGAVQKKFIKVD